MADFSFAGGVLPPGATLTRASVGWAFDAARTLASFAADLARFDHEPSSGVPRGLLNEPAATNAVRNATASGAVAGSPGTQPTFWNPSVGANGLTRTLATGSEDGIAYLDVRYAGTPTATSNVTITFELNSIVAALVGQTWALNLFLSVAGGTMANVDALALYIQQRDAANAFLSSLSQPVTVAAGALRGQRKEMVATVAAPTTAFLRPLVSFNYTLGLPIDITLRFGLPNLAQAAVTTSPIITTGAGAVTRAADVVTLALGNGLHDVVVTRGAGATTYAGQLVTSGNWIVPTDASPLLAVSASPAPALAYDFMPATLPPGATLTRASAGWYFAMPNVLRNPTFAGGVAGSPGTMPANFLMSGQGTLTRTLAFGTDGGVPYMDVRLSGTTSTTSCGVAFETVGQIPAFNGQSWFLTDFVSMPAGSTANLQYVRQNLTEFSAVPAFIRSANGVPLNLTPTPSNAPLLTQPHSTTILLPASAGTPTAFVAPNLAIGFSVGAVIDITLRLGQPKLATPTLTSAAVDVPRFTYDPVTAAFLGLLDEPAATNSLRNSSGAGANGTSTMPLTWGSGGVLNGLVRTFTQVTEDGFPAVDVRVSGTPIATGTLNSEFSTRTAGIACAIGQTWTGSLNHRLSGGTLNNVSLLFVVAEHDAAGVVVGGQASLAVVPTAAPLKSQRLNITKTLAQPTGITITEYLRFSYTVGLAVDITVRVFPQLAQVPAAGLTSPIVTSGTAVTRAADILSVVANNGPSQTVVITRASGVTTLSGVTVGGASYAVPVDPSPVQRVTITRTVGIFLAIVEAPDRIAIQMVPGWPMGLPCPSVAGYAFRPAAAVDRLDLDIGAARVYRRTRRPLIEVPVQWQFDATQQTAFDRFQTLVLQEGAQWFALSLPLPAGFALAVVRFKGGVQMAALGNKRWQTTATLELLDRPVMSAAELTAALGDGGAMAWPEGKLPCPLLAGWQIATNPATVHTAEMPGLPQARRRSRNSMATAPAAWELDATQAALFDSFLRWRGCDGAQWISFPLVQANGTQAADVRFTGEAEWTPRERGRWSVSAPFEIRERPL